MRPLVMPYTPNQIEAIETLDQNLQIIACAGAGKTQVLAERVAELLAVKSQAGIQPRNIVAFTFTERAGAELKDRILQRVHERLGDVHGMAEMYVGTIHGYCLQLLEAHIPEYFKYTVLNEVQARLLIDRNSSKSGLTDLQLKRWIDSRLYQDILSVLREADIDEAVLTDHPARHALDKYQTLLDEKRYLDYTEIMVRAVTALYSDHQLRRRISDQTRYLIVDEYQDVNPLQEALIRLLHDLGANTCVVGDDDQTVYQFRGSDVDNIITFADRYPGVATVSIEANYRSSAGVVEAARTVISHNDPHRVPKFMVSTDMQPSARGDLMCLTLRSPIEEASWIAHKIRSMIGLEFRDAPDAEPRGLAPSDFAILLRSVKRTGDPIVQALVHDGLPVVVAGMTTLFESVEVRAAVTLFDFMVNRAGPDELHDAWLNADLGIDSERLQDAIDAVAKQREWKRGERWSVYNLQRTFHTFLEHVALREELIGERGEIVYYNLGKFSQVISDYEQIHFRSDPQQKYLGFANFLQFQASDYYPEGWQEAAYVRPNAVQVMTIHQAKGMEWPVVFVPCLQNNRFPPKRPGGKGRWHVIPREAVAHAERFDGTLEDERRLLYVALTRSKKYLFCSWAPDEYNRLYGRASPFVGEILGSPRVLTAEPSRPAPVRLEPQPRQHVSNVALSFSELKYFFECPYQFKLRFLYGFNPPLHEALGYGKSLHDALAEVHKRALEGDMATPADAGLLVDRHLNLPFAYPQLQEDLRSSAINAIRRYLRTNAQLLLNTEHVEQVVEIDLGDGLIVNGRIDLIRRLDTGETTVIDFKSTERAQEEDVTKTQLHIYALGYRELTGAAPDLIEVYNLDERGRQVREEVSTELEQETRVAILAAALALRVNRLARLTAWCDTCARCDLAGICRSGPPRP